MARPHVGILHITGMHGTVKALPLNYEKSVREEGADKKTPNPKGLKETVRGKLIRFSVK